MSITIRLSDRDLDVLDKGEKVWVEPETGLVLIIKKNEK